jgi:uncharacterized membrane protein YecN with MAPEG domain
MGDFILPVTLTTAAGLALINLWLQVRIGQVRMAEKIEVGDGGNERMIRRMRAQANLVENAPFVWALIAGIELARGTSTWLWAVSGLFLLARVAHPFGMDGWKLGRPIGTGITMAVLLGLAIYAAYLGWAGQPHLTPLVVTSAS